MSEARRSPEQIAAIRAAIAAEYAAMPPVESIWRPGTPDSYADGLLRGYHAAKAILAKAGKP